MPVLHARSAPASLGAALILTWATLLPLAAPAVGAEAAARPNIVIVYADDMGYGDLGIQNPDSKIPTPHLDRLAREGMRLTDAHSSAAICSPSRYALLTGSYHWRRLQDIVQPFGPSVFKSADLTLPEMLKAEGYRTACIGKWHLGWDWDAIKNPGAAPPDPKLGYAADAFDWSKPIAGGPTAQGFDYYFGNDVPNFPPYTWFENDHIVGPAPTMPVSPTGGPAEGGWDTWAGPMPQGWDFYAVVPKLTQQTVDWIGQQRGKEGPFFLYVPLNSPHTPIVPIAEFRGRSQAGGYGDWVAQTDDNVGRILKALDDNGFAQNTLVVFSSDNGPEASAYNRVRKFDHRSAGPLRGVKRDLWEGGHRVPMIVRWPGHVKPETVSDELVSQVDLMATLAAVVGHALPAGSAPDSYNQLPVWEEGAASPRHAIVHNGVNGSYAVRHDQWLLVAAKTGAVSRVPDWLEKEQGDAENEYPGELYDLSQDLGERRNLYGEHPDKVGELKALLGEIRAKGQVR
ncbi:MAG TPA: sulfatase-like hydrolase/transferase [Pirellulales bacterium]|jgi:arylsulfatase A|nr:sulfatase-like hydrolase/transferase [Pirellulales bacterium]